MILALAALARAQEPEDVALAALVHAQDTGLPADYAAALEPLTAWARVAQGPDRFQAAWYTAYAYQGAMDDDRAVPIYEALIDTAAYHPHGDGAVVEVVRALLAELRRDEGDLQALPPGTPVELQYHPVLAPESTVTIYALSELDVAFIAAADRALTWTFAAPAPDQPDFAAYVASQRAALTYLPAQLLFTHGRFDDARPRLLALLDDPRTRCSDEASYAATYLIDTYQQEGDLTQIRLYTKRFILNPPGCRGLGTPTPWPPDPPPPPPRPEQVEFKLCLEATRAEDHAAAAECFLTYTTTFPTSEYRDEALYNAANQYDLAGKAEPANELYAQFVDEYPRDEKSAALYFRIAANHEQVLELAEAIDHYGRLIANFPTSPVAADAQYNLAFLSIGAGDPLAAARGFEAYASRYPNKDDAVDTLWRAGEQYEVVGATQAIAFYEKFRRDHAADSADRLLQADARLAALYARVGNAAKSRAYEERLLTDWAALEAAGRTGEVGRPGRHAVAASAFSEVQRRFEAVTDAQSVEAFRQWSVGQAIRFGDFETASGVFYLNAKALLPYDRVQAERELDDLLALAREKKLWSPWQDLAAAALHELDPDAYPAPMAELKGAVGASVPPALGPLPVRP